MKRSYFLSILFISLIWIFSNCSTKRESENPTDNLAGDTISESRVQIKAFWDVYRKAQKYRVEGNWREAALAYEQALEINPDHEDSWFNLGNMYLEMDEGLKSETCWQNIVTENPNSARAHMQLGRLYLSYERSETFDLEKAEYEFKTAAAINKVITGPLVQLGYVSLLKGENEKSYDYFQSVTATDTKSVEPHFLLGYLAWKNDDLEKMQVHIVNAHKLATANKSPSKDLSEGDTKDGKSHVRPINQSIFQDYSMGLGEFSEEKIQFEMINRFQKLDINLKVIQKQIGS